MKKTALICAISAITVASSAQAGVNLNVNIGVPVPGVRVSVPPPTLFAAPPLFIVSPRLGFYVGVDTPYDIIFNADFYYLYYGNSWHRSRYYNGPWVEVPYRRLPPDIRNRRIEQIRSYRDREYREYRNDRERFRGRYFRPGHERREEWRDERRRDKEEWKGDHWRDKEERMEERRDGRRHDRGRD